MQPGAVLIASSQVEDYAVSVLEAPVPSHPGPVIIDSGGANFSVRKQSVEVQSAGASNSPVFAQFS